MRRGPSNCVGAFSIRNLIFPEVPATMLNDDLKNVLNDAKSAVRAYARDPSNKNAEQVETAWQTVKRLRAASNWRRPGQDQ